MVHVRIRQSRRNGVRFAKEERGVILASSRIRASRSGCLLHALWMKSENDNRATEVREHLANERTLLSWVRTGLGLISFGIVVERAGTLALASGGGGGNASRFLGLVMALLGCLTLVLGTQQFLRNRRQISEGQFVSTARTYLVIVAGGLILGSMFVVYVLFAG